MFKKYLVFSKIKKNSQTITFVCHYIYTENHKLNENYFYLAAIIQNEIVEYLEKKVKVKSFRKLKNLTLL